MTADAFVYGEMGGEVAAETKRGRRGWIAKGRKREQGMNKLEQAYSDRLDEMLARGEILWRSKHEAIKLRLADNTYFIVDFFVLNKNSELEAHDVKGGFIPAKNMAKLKYCAETFPFRVFTAKRPRVKEPWIVEEI